MVRSRRLELPRVAPQRPQRCASTSSATTARLCSGAAGNTKSRVSNQAQAVERGKTAGRMEWRIDDSPVAYGAALAEMDARVAAIRAGSAPELVWLLEHPPLYTAGTSARDEDLLDPSRLPVHRTGRGGRHTYHGPGQRIAYVMLDLDRRDRDVRCHVHRLEEWIIRTLARFAIKGERRDGRVGIWVARPGGG